MEERKSVKVVVMRGRHDDWDTGDDRELVIPSRLGELATWAATMLAEVPSEFRADARLRLSGDGGYDGDGSVAVTIYYTRPETDAEMRSRIAIEQRMADARTTAERRQYEQLKAKYERP